MKSILSAILTTLLLGTFSSGVACEQPKDMVVPNGLTASETEMHAADKNYRRFMDAMRAYQDCLATDSDEFRPGAEDNQGTRQHEELFVEQHNAASAVMIRITEQFNKAIDAYKTR